MKPGMAHNLNPTQQAAVQHCGGHLLIVAGPGTGKTHTLACRIVQAAGNLPPGKKILAVTFTNRAAQELRERLLPLIPELEAKVFVGTFHQFGLAILREYSAQLDIPKDFMIASPDDVETAIKTVWPDKQRRDRKLFQEEVSRWKSTRFFEETPSQIFALTEYLRSQALLDFDDLLLETWRFLKRQEEVLAGMQARYPLIFVDEYQDINPLQHALLKIMTGIKSEITAIGDPNQAIYGFRGSDVKFFSTFTEDFPGAAILALSENYRSAKNILSASSQVMAKNQRFTVPELTAKIIKQGRLVIHEAATDKAEAEYVVHQIEKMVGGTSMFSQDSKRVGRQAEAALSFGDIAVLYRLNSQARALKAAFERSGIPFCISGAAKPENGEDVVEDVYFAPTKEVEIKAEKVSLLTIHSAKGLEFPAVFIVGCEEHLLPLDLEGLAADTEEERRLFYVAMTRAKEWLIFVRAKKRSLYGKTYLCAASPFLLDIEEDLKEYEKHAIKRSRRTVKDDQMTLF